VPKARYTGHSVGDHELRPESLMMGYGYDPMLSEGAAKCPIFQTSTFVFPNAEAGKAYFQLAYGLREAGPGEESGLIYSRLNNPDLEILEDRLGLWDGAEAGAVFASGMAAISTALMAYLRPGDAIVFSEPLYGGTEHLILSVLPEFGISPVGFPAGRPIADVAADIRARVGKWRVPVVYIETPANPTNAMVDIADLAAFARTLEANGTRPRLMVDNTFLGPLWQHPLRHGADLVIYSATKFIGGHSDLVAGAVLGTDEAMQPVRALRTFMGTMADAWTGWLLMRSLETLKMRMTAMMKNARYCAEFLNDHAKVRQVFYLGLIREGDPQYAIYRKQCGGPGSLIAFDVEGGEAGAFRFLNALKLIKLAVSLGGTESLAEHPGSMTHSDVPPGDQLRMGITPGLVRLSVGVEHFEDLIADLSQALTAV
jgi:methionine-gamma-lyase